MTPNEQGCSLSSYVIHILLGPAMWRVHDHAIIYVQEICLCIKFIKALSSFLFQDGKKRKKRRLSQAAR